jgi:hypothetical protein
MVIVKFVRAFFTFWYNFIVGDDWTVAAATAITLGFLVFLAHEHRNVWWLLPLVVVAVLGMSLRRATEQ